LFSIGVGIVPNPMVLHLLNWPYFMVVQYVCMMTSLLRR